MDGGARIGGSMIHMRKILKEYETVRKFDSKRKNAETLRT
jgi:hypothetical protein